MSNLYTVPYKAFAELSKVIDEAFSEDLNFDDPDMRIRYLSEDYLHKRADNMRKFINMYIDEKEKMQISFLNSLSDVLE